MAESRENHLGKYLAAMLVGRTGLTGGERERFSGLVEQLTTVMDEGHNCLPINGQDRAVLESTDIVSADGLTPLILYNNCLYLHRYFHYETRLARQLHRLSKKECQFHIADEVFDTVFGMNTGNDDLQRAAAELATRKRLAIVSGGPGTGKTSTVVRILAILLHGTGQKLNIALAAPTGKAAMRLQQSVREAVARLPFDKTIRERIPNEAMTIHRLLGVRRNSVHFRHSRENPLGWDLVVVDEASMVDLALMSKLVDALHPESGLILLGDKDQLASVESGAVLADLVDSLEENTVVLKKSYRFDTAIGGLAEAVNNGDWQEAWNILESRDYANVEYLPLIHLPKLLNGYDDYMDRVQTKDANDLPELFDAFNNYRILCAVRHGRAGVEGMNGRIEHRLARKFGCQGNWYQGKPVMVMRNDYSLDLYNGDVGICMEDPGDGILKVWFEKGERGNVRSFLPGRLPQWQTAYAMTVHKSQGSEFGRVAIVLPDEENQVLSRELLYTAVTRARKSLVLCGAKGVASAALQRKTVRYSNLHKLLVDMVPDV